MYYSIDTDKISFHQVKILTEVSYMKEKQNKRRWPIRLALGIFLEDLRTMLEKNLYGR